MTTLRLVLVALIASSAIACASSGQLGATGNVRFSQVESFAETTDFGPPIVTGAGLLIQLEYPDGALSLVETINPQLDLVVADGNASTATSPSSNAEVLPLGFAQYAITLKKSGTFTLLAEQNGKVVDFLAVTAADAASIRWHSSVSETIVQASSSQANACGTSESLTSAVLAPNDNLSFVVVPQDAQGNALLGMLQLSAQSTGPVTSEGGLLGQGLTPNSISFAPNGSLGAPANITVTDAVTGGTLTLTLPTTTTDAACQ